MRVAQLGAFQTVTSQTSLFISLVNKIARSFHEIFMGQGFWGDSAFDFQSTWVILLGLALFFAKPNWKSALLFMAVVLGIAPHILSHDEYNGRALAMVSPLLLLGALGIERFFVFGQGLWNRKQWNLFFSYSRHLFFCLASLGQLSIDFHEMVLSPRRGDYW